MIFAVMGGDERNLRLARMLTTDGHTVRAYALESAALPQSARHCLSASEAALGADCVVLPLPASSRRGYLNAPLSQELHCLGEVMSALTPGLPVCAGMPDDYARELAEKSGLALYDYYEREELLAKNAVATAEGAIGVILSNTCRTLHGSRVLVLGRGRLGRALCPRLRGLGASVALSSRNAGDMAWTRAEGCEALDSRALEGRLGDFDIVVNTVPAPILTGPLLSELKSGALVVDLASRPGGVDAEAARALGVRHIHALGLPGKWAPDSAAEAVKEAIYNILGEFN